MGAPLQDFYGPPKGCIGTDFHATASATLAVPSDFIGGEYHTSAASLWTNNIIKNAAGWNIYGFTVQSTGAAIYNISFFAAKGDKSTYDVALGNTLYIPASAAAGSYFPIGGEKGRYWGTDLSTTIIAAGFAFKASNNALLGTLWWEPCGSY